ncbi:unnamed protein product [Sphagnum jensenii]
MVERIIFTKRSLENIRVPDGARAKTFHDIQLKGLQVIATEKGVISFYVRKVASTGRAVRIFIGRFPDMTVEQARKKALAVLNDISQGIDVKAEKRQDNATTLGQLFQQYIDQYATEHCVATKEISGVFRRYFADWQTRELSSLTNADVQKKINTIGHEHGKTAANHALTYGRAAINWCLRLGITKATNPFLGVSKFKLSTRERFLKPDEMTRFFQALGSFDNRNGFRDYIFLSLFTGARRTNVLSMKWSELDFDLGTWTIPRTKNGESQVVPLTSLSLEILQRRSNDRQSEWVFPGTGTTGHLVEPKKYWKALLKAAEIDNLRIHDLRRTFGSYMAMGNQSLHMIGKVLGHKSATATQIYARFSNDPVRTAMEKAQQDILQAAKIFA